MAENQTTSGLDSVSETTSTGIPVKSQAIRSKSGLIFPQIAGDTELPASILQQMEDLYRRKMQEGTGLLAGLQKAAAISSAGRPGGSSALLQSINEQEAQRAADLFNIRSQIEMAKQRAAQGQEWQQSLGFGGAQPSAGGAQPSAGGAQPAAIPQWQTMVNSLPEAVRPQAIRAYKSGNIKAWEDLFQKFGMEEFKAIESPEAAKSQFRTVFYDEDGKTVRIEDLSLKQQRLLERAGRLISPIGSSAAPVGAAPVGAAPVGTAPVGAAPVGAAPVGAAPVGAAPVGAAPSKGPSLASYAPEMFKNVSEVKEDSYTFKNLTPKQVAALEKAQSQVDVDGTPLRSRGEFSRVDLSQKFDAYPLEIRRKLFDMANNISGEAPTQVTEEPTSIKIAEASSAVKKPNAYPEVSKILAERELRKEEQKAEIDVRKKDLEKFLDQTDYGRTTELASTSREILSLLPNSQKVLGYFQTPGTASGLGYLLKEGISAPGGHSIGIKELAGGLIRAQEGVKKEDLTKRNRLESLFEKLALYSSSVYKGQGSVTEFERAAIKRMVGSVEDNPANLYKIQQAMLARAEFDQARGQLYRDKGLTLTDLKRDQDYIAIEQEFKNKLKKIEDAPLVVPNSTNLGGTAPGGTKWKVIKQ